MKKPTHTPIHTKYTKFKSHGFTLIEIMIALAIMGGALGLILAYQNKAEASQKANRTVEDVSLLASKIKTMYGPMNSYATVTATSLNDMGLTPGGMSFATPNIVDAYGNTVSITGAAASFAITIGGATGPLDKEICSSIATNLSTQATAINVGGAATAAAGAVSGGSAYKTTAGALSVANLATGCATASPVIALQFR